MANIVRLRVERKVEPDAFKFMCKAWKRQRGWIEREHRLHSAHETKSQKKRRKKREAWIKLQKEAKKQNWLKQQKKFKDYDD